MSSYNQTSFKGRNLTEFDKVLSATRNLILYLFLLKYVECEKRPTKLIWKYL